MSDNALQATLSSDFGQLLAGMKSLQTEMKATKAEVKALGRETNGFQQQAVNSLKATKIEANALGISIKEAAAAFSKMGGPLGSIAGRIGGASGLTGMFGMLGAAAIAAGVSINIAMARAEKSAAAAGRTIQNAIDLANSRKQGAAAAAEQAVGALSHSDALGKAVFRSGPNAIKEAQDLAAAQGVSLDSAAEVVALMSDLKGPVKTRAYKAAGDASRTGTVSFVDAAKLIMTKGQLQSDLQLPEGAGATEAVAARTKVAAKIIKMATSPESDPFGKYEGFGYESLIPGVNMVRDDPTLDQFRRMNSAKAKIESAGVNNVMNPEVMKALGTAIYDAINVQTKAERELRAQRELEIFKVQAEATEVMKTLSGRIADLVEIMKEPLGGATPLADRAAEMRRELNAGSDKVVKVQIVQSLPPRSH